MRLLLPALAIVAAAGCGGESPGPETPPADGYLLRIDQRVGHKASYDIDIQMKEVRQVGEGGMRTTESSLATSFDTELVEIKDDLFGYELVPGRFNMTRDGERSSFDADKEPKNYILDSKGKLFSADPVITGLLPTAVLPFAGMVVYPSDRIMVYDTWSQQTDVGGFRIRWRYTLTGVERVGDVNAVTVEAAISESELFSTERPLRFWIHPVTGQVLRCEGSLALQAPGGRMEMTIRVEAGAKAED